MATKERVIVAEPGSSPVSLSMCFEQAPASANPELDVDLMFGSIAEQVIKQVSCTLLLLQSAQHEAAAEEPAIEVWENSFVPHVVETVQVGSTDRKRDALEQNEMDQVANRLAERGRRTEQQYDQAHSLFSK